MQELEITPIIELKENDPRYVPNENIISISSRYGFLADDPGYGKSLTILSLIMSNKKLYKRIPSTKLVKSDLKLTYPSKEGSNDPR